MATSKRRPTALVSVFGSIHTDVMTDETGVPALPGFEDRFDPALLQALGDIAALHENRPGAMRGTVRVASPTVRI